MARNVAYLSYYRKGDTDYPSGHDAFIPNADFKTARLTAIRLIRTGKAISRGPYTAQVTMQSGSQWKQSIGEGTIGQMVEINGVFYYENCYEGSANILYIVDPRTGNIRKSPIQSIRAIVEGASAPKRIPAKKPASKPKATPKGKNPGTLVAVVDGKFAPVNGFSYPKTLVKTFAKNMESIYARMYDGEIDEDPWVDKGDRLLKTNKRLVAALAVERQDLLTSDREIAAFAYALAHSKDRSKLLAIDKPSAPAKKPASKRVQSTFDRGWRSWHPR